MTEHVQRLRVFVASPGDTAVERNGLDAVIRQLNQGIAAELGYVIDLVRWETHTRPGIGTDAQAVINRQLPTKPDVVIGIFWKRIGTPTPRAPSGTVEEIQMAIERYATDKRIELLVYFDQTPYTLRDDEIDQMKNLLAFQKDLEKQGVYYWKFNGDEDFSNLVREHLTASLRSLHASDSIQPAQRTFSRGHEVSSSANIEVGNAEDVELLVASLRDDWNRDGFGRHTVNRASLILIELIANVRNHSTVARADIEVSKSIGVLRSIKILVRQHAAGFDLDNAISSDWSAYQSGAREHGLAKAHRLADYLSTTEREDGFAVTATVFDYDPIGSGVFDDFNVPSFRIEHDIPGRCWVGERPCSTRALMEAAVWSVKHDARRVLELYFGAVRATDNSLLGIEVTGEIAATVTQPLNWARSIASVYPNHFKNSRVVFHVSNTDTPTEKEIMAWAAYWSAPIFTDVNQLRAYLTETTRRDQERRAYYP
ncbi:hypothetical protein [Leekyejoonella antrihumi]|uniref:DUF4062 domain-containing protein n=1 Tax=Leekyejoonella antrihumi TaxID=1660198 RepID=A0A563DRT8_9MICO|nr:hypothetical protein [Leekyejoonella antrihumi]TWP32960.1 hypothetical protein FGL98_22720 [Leekyejoonella antrihumi]